MWRIKLVKHFVSGNLFASQIFLYAPLPLCSNQIIYNVALLSEPPASTYTLIVLLK